MPTGFVGAGFAAFPPAVVRWLSKNRCSSYLMQAERVKKQGSSVFTPIIHLKIKLILPE
jgi:hypothetical protein